MTMPKMWPVSGPSRLVIRARHGETAGTPFGKDALRKLTEWFPAINDRADPDTVCRIKLSVARGVELNGEGLSVALDRRGNGMCFKLLLDIVSL
jgi:hypothetical protein